MTKFFLIIFLKFLSLMSFAIGDSIYSDKIKSIRFHAANNQTSLPIYRLNSNDKLTLSFDDMQQTVRSYYYCLQWVDANWKSFDINSFDYINGYNQQRITNYKYSSIALTKYTHYSIELPDSKLMPKKSGNYILKVYLNGDTSQLMFTRRMFVLEPLTSVQAMITQPLSLVDANNYQRLRFTVKTLADVSLNSLDQRISVCVVQNNKWSEARNNILPTFRLQNGVEFSDEPSLSFLSGKEWRWVNLRMIRLQTERIDSAKYEKFSTEMFVKADSDQNGFRYQFWEDINGMFFIESHDKSINVEHQGDYAKVNFYYKPNEDEKLNYDFYLYGQLTDFKLNNSNKCYWDEAKNCFTQNLLLKQGFYNYTFLKKHKKTGEVSDTQGNFFETENKYDIFVYYRDFGDRNDRLIGYGVTNSRINRRGLGF